MASSEEHSLGRTLYGFLGMSYNLRNILFLKSFLDKTVSAGEDSPSLLVAVKVKVNVHPATKVNQDELQL